MSNIQYNVNIDQTSIQDSIDKFSYIGGNIDDAIRIAINKAAPKVITESSKRIRSQVRLPASYVRDKLNFIKATRGKLSGAITTPSRGLLLSRFSTNSEIANSETSSVIIAPKVTRNGIKVKVKPDGISKVFNGDFETKPNKPFYMVLRNSGAIGIVARMKTAGKRGGKIKAFHGPSLSQVFSHVRDDVLDFAEDEYKSQILKAMTYLMKKLPPPEYD